MWFIVEVIVGGVGCCWNGGGWGEGVVVQCEVLLEWWWGK